MKSYLPYFIAPILVWYLFILNLAKAQDFSLLEDQFAKSVILPKHHFGFSLYDLDSSRFVFGKQEDQHFTPASNTKVFTLFTALKTIGDSIPGIQYVQRGDSLIFWGTGDPTFLHPKLDTRRVYDFLHSAEAKYLYYVPQSSSEPAYREGWAIEDYAYDYQPEVASFPIYGNVVRFKASGKDLIAIPSYFNTTVGISDRSSKYFSVTRALNSNRFDRSALSVPSGYGSSKPFIWSDSLLVKLLQDTLHRPIEALPGYEKPADIKTLYSSPRNHVLREMMLPSDNFLAEHLTMVAADIRYQGFYTDSLRTEIHKTYYSHFLDSIELRDGSGLSTYNSVSPRSMIQVLLEIKKLIPDENQRYLFFPAGGVDGTLKNAYALDQGTPFVWAKTGTIHAVHCQSGYIVTRTGRRYAFSFLNNNFITSTSNIRKEMVKIMTFIRQNY
ncbi:D-alanyl-D-alanine carboxypeptidase [Sphingobacterium faecale]|uniref:D-alanyl-D-alanine carboxypeptidase n=1 Tax=Sphingobacterium faecale TaxID=2803775 RepID=A0ABS1R1M8_9SPHI|nr:D-alanyl-D-alanine carboxypeptidase [Sphingobacterium faecale]MBL1408590.1 D-alanyl-D-alanine carboxypeptidase [Sphingobacterium faecale]